MVTVLPAATFSTRVKPLPLIVMALCPGPLMVRFLLMASSLLREMVPVRPLEKVIVAPALATPRTCRNEPRLPSSFRLITVLGGMLVGVLVGVLVRVGVALGVLVGV